MTKEERHLWYDFLKTYTPGFHRQKPFGNYIADFYCPRVKLIVELDGSQHYEEKGLEYDQERSTFFNNLGVVVLRYTNIDVWQRFREVCEEIDCEVKNILAKG